MKKIGTAIVVFSGLAAAILGLAAPAPATSSSPVLDSAFETKIGVDHLDWLDDIRPKVNVPTVDTSVERHTRNIVLRHGEPYARSRTDVQRVSVTIRATLGRHRNSLSHDLLCVTPPWIPRWCACDDATRRISALIAGSRLIGTPDRFSARTRGQDPSNSRGSSPEKSLRDRRSGNRGATSCTIR